MKEDNGRIVRLLPIVAGSIAGTLLMLNRLLTPELTDSQARSDAVGVILTAVLILTGLLWQQVQPRKPDSIILEGTAGFELREGLVQQAHADATWVKQLQGIRESVLLYRAESPSGVKPDLDSTMTDSLRTGFIPVLITLRAFCNETDEDQR